MKKFISLSSALLIASLNAQNSSENLINIPEVKIADWEVVNDGVMGGISSSSIKKSADSLIFKGQLSLENNGGFASVRYLLNKAIPKEADHILLRVKGDGRRYQFRVRNNANFDGVSYKFDFETKANESQDIVIPIAALKSSFRGRHMPQYSAPKASEIKQIGFLIADKKTGAFALEITSISYFKMNSGENQ
jgi:NADH dehydrogenase [ubiquinone] 1 alpha subcomplex assembly factor 1